MAGHSVIGFSSVFNLGPGLNMPQSSSIQSLLPSFLPAKLNSSFFTIRIPYRKSNKHIHYPEYTYFRLDLSFVFIVMPLQTHWTCGVCGFGPMKISIYPSCISCGHRACACCAYDSFDSAALHTESFSACENSLAEMDCSHSNDCHYHTCTTPSLPLPGATMETLRDFSGPTVKCATDLYICCSCGDGPKIYQNQGRCVNCNHDVCGYCTHVK